MPGAPSNHLPAVCVFVQVYFEVVKEPSLETPCELTLGFLTSKQIEKLDVVRDQHAALTTVVADQRIKEIPVEGAEVIGASHNRSVDNWVVIRVGKHNTRSRARENNL